MNSQKNGTEIDAPRMEDPGVSTRDFVQPGNEEDALHPVEKFLLDFLARRRKNAGLPPPATREDHEDDLRSISSPTADEMEESRRAVESARKRREAKGE